MRKRSMFAVLFIFLSTTIVTPMVGSVSAQQPDLVQEHWYHSYATLTIDVNAWADDYPEIVNLLVIGETELGRNLWMLQISDWSQETKPDGSEKEVVYIDGGHHGNEHLGTELAFLTAEYYIEGWGSGNQDAIDVLSTTELHILIMLNADGNDHDTRWNINQVDLNRNYDHYWNTCPTTQPGSSAFSESETLANSIYMNTVVPDADLYVTMHTGVWIMLYPWGKWPEQPSDWELFHSIRDDVHANISDIPIQNANQGLYPNCGTSRDYGYGVMGYPTFTFETDDEQWALGTVEPLSSRLGEELDVMNYLIENVWYWRARLNITSMDVDPGNQVNLKVRNLGQASTANATLQYLDESGIVLWNSSNFTVNATNSSSVVLDATNLSLVDGGSFQLYYQKRVVDSAMWVNESIPSDSFQFVSLSESGSSLSATLVLSLQLTTIPLFLIALLWVIRKSREINEDEGGDVEGRWKTFVWIMAANGSISAIAYSAAWYMFSYHTRMLGGKESLVILHVGLVIVAFGVGAAIFGYVADRWGKRKELLISALGASICLSLITPLLGTIPFVIVSTIHSGILGCLRLLFSVVSEIFPNNQSKSIGMMHAVSWTCASIVILLLGPLYENFGFWVISMIMIAFFANAIYCTTRIGSSLTTFVETQNATDEHIGLTNILKFSSPWPIFILAVVLAISIPRGAVVQSAPRYLEMIGSNVTFTSILISWAQLAGVVLLAFAGYFCDRFGASTVLLWSAIGYCTVWSIFTLGLPIWLASIVYVIPIYGLLIVSSDVLMSENSTLAERNRAIGLSSATTLLGQGIGTAIMFSSLLYLETTSLSQVAQYHWAFRIHIPMFMLAVFLAWMLVTKMDGKNKTSIDAILVPTEST